MNFAITLCLMVEGTKSTVEASKQAQSKGFARICPTLSPNDSLIAGATSFASHSSVIPLPSLTL
jgi:hypothetical protein